MRVGFVGLGNMGEPMANRIANAGFDLTVFDPRAGTERRCVEAGAVLALNVREIARRCDACLICVTDDQQVRSVVAELFTCPADLLSVTHIAIHSTVLPETVADISQQAVLRGISVVDAPVSGSIEARNAGSLAMMVGGSQADLRELRPVFETCASSIFHAGESGAGAALKLVNNLLAVMGLLATAEACRLANAFQIDETTMRAAISVSTGDCYAMRNLEFWRDFPSAHPLGRTDEFMDFMSKDLRTITAAARNYGVGLPLTRAALEHLPETLRQFWRPDNS